VIGLYSGMDAFSRLHLPRLFESVTKFSLRCSKGPIRRFALFGLTVDAIYRRDDQVTQKDRWVVSADRQKMTLTTTGTFETGQRATEKLVFQKQ
jgi:hypothetical protein